MTYIPNAMKRTEWHKGALRNAGFSEREIAEIMAATFRNLKPQYHDDPRAIRHIAECHCPLRQASEFDYYEKCAKRPWDC